MFDDRSFSRSSFDDRSWFFDLVQAVAARGRRLFVVARDGILVVLQSAAELWVTKRG